MGAYVDLQEHREAPGTIPAAAVPKRRRNEVSESDIIEGSRNREKSKRLKENEKTQEALAHKSRAKKVAPGKTVLAQTKASAKKTAPAKSKNNSGANDTTLPVPTEAAKRPTRTRREKKAK